MRSASAAPASPAPSARATAIAQAVLARLCGPRSREAAKRLLERPEVGARDPQLRRVAGDVGVAQRRDVGVVDAQHGGVARALALEHAQLGRRVGLERPVAVEVVGRHVEQHGDVGAEALDAFELKARELAHDRPPGLDACPANDDSAVPTLPAPTLGTPPASSMAAVSSVVVVLPLVPVMPTIGLRSSSRRYASSTSAHTGIPAERAARTISASSGTPGLLTSRSAPSEKLGIVATEHRFDARGRLPCIGPPIGQHDVHVRSAAPQRLGRGEPGADGPEHDDPSRAGEYLVHQVYWLNRR